MKGNSMVTVILFRNSEEGDVTCPSAQLRGIISHRTLNDAEMNSGDMEKKTQESTAMEPVAVKLNHLTKDKMKIMAIKRKRKTATETKLYRSRNSKKLREDEEEKEKKKEKLITSNRAQVL